MSESLKSDSKQEVASPVHACTVSVDAGSKASKQSGAAGSGGAGRGLAAAADVAHTRALIDRTYSNDEVSVASI